MAQSRISESLQVIAWLVAIALALAGAGYALYDSEQQNRLDTTRLRIALKSIDTDSLDALRTQCGSLVASESQACRARIETEAETRRRDETDLYLRRQAQRWSALSAYAALAFPAAVLLTGFLLWLRGGRKILENAAAPPVAAAVAAPLVAADPLADDGKAASRADERGVRAYLHVSEALIEFFDEWISCSLRLTNSGQSPALGVVVHGSIQVVGTGNWNASQSITSEEAISLRIDVASRETREVALIWHRAQIDDQIFFNLKARTMAFDVVGKIDWNDVFGEREPQTILLRDAGVRAYLTGRAQPLATQLIYLPSYEA